MPASLRLSTILATLSIALAMPSYCQENAGTSPSTATPPPAVTPATPATPKPAVTPAPKVAKKKPTITRTIDTQLSGFTSQDADQVFARLSLLENKKLRDWFVRASYTRTATKNGYESHVNTMKLDSRLERRKLDGKYKVWTGVISRRDRELPKRSTKSGYHLLSYGTGKPMGARMKGDIGLGLVEVYDNGDGTKPAVVASIRGRRPLNGRLALESDILAIQPMDRFRATKIDSDLALVHEFAPGLSLRLGWSVNNLIRPVRGSHEWDSVVRLVVGYRHTSAH